jgi:hypothetical protein
MDSRSVQNKNRHLVGYVLDLVQALKICSSIRLEFLVAAPKIANIEKSLLEWFLYALKVNLDSSIYNARP